jgi:hypothetical protein
VSILYRFATQIKGKIQDFGKKKSSSICALLKDLPSPQTETSMAGLLTSPPVQLPSHPAPKSDNYAIAKLSTAKFRNCKDTSAIN